MLLRQRLFTGSAELFLRCRSCLRERTDEEDQLPALIFGHALLEGRHWFSALADLVEERTVGNGVHVTGVGEIGWFGIVAHGFGAVALASVDMAIGAAFPVQNSGGLERRFGRLQRISAGLGFFGDDPRFVLLKESISGGHENENEKHNE